TWTRTLVQGALVFRGIDELSPHDVWAVGQESVNGYGDLSAAYHFDGHQWRRYATPNPLGKYDIDQNWLTSVHAISTGDIWATGRGTSLGRGHRRPAVPRALGWQALELRRDSGSERRPRQQPVGHRPVGQRRFRGERCLGGGTRGQRRPQRDDVYGPLGRYFVDTVPVPNPRRVLGCLT